MKQIDKKINLTHLNLEEISAKLVDMNGEEVDLGRGIPIKEATAEPIKDDIILKEFIENKENKQKANILAYQINQEFSNWFSMPQLLKKFKVDLPTAANQIEMLMLFNVCIGKVEKNKPFFKIDLDQRAQRKLLLDEIAIYEGRVLFLKEKLSKLN